MLHQGLTNPRTTLGETSHYLSSISTGTQGTQGLPLTIFPIPNFYLCRNTSLSKTQGPPLVHILAKPKVCPWYTFLQNPRSALGAYFYLTQGIPLVRSHVATTTTTIKGPSSTKRTATPLFGKTFNQVKAHTHSS